jgi:hypothetical protein
MSLVPDEHLDIWGRFCDDTGLSGEEVVSSVTCPVPVPRYPLRRCRPGARAEALWHPFLWLPAHIAFPRDDDEAGDDDLFALRVAMEAEATGLYDQGTGTWLDVCAAVGVDLDRPDGQARAWAWLDGAPDPSFDDIDLTDWTMAPEGPYWASDVAAAVLQSRLEAVWSESADAQLEVLAGLLDDGMADEDLLALVRAVAGTSATWFRRVPALGPPRLPGRPSDAFEALEARLEAPGLSARDLRYEVVPALADVLSVVKETYRPAVEALLEDAEGEGATTGGSRINLSPQGPGDDQAGPIV